MSIHPLHPVRSKHPDGAALGFQNGCGFLEPRGHDFLKRLAEFRLALEKFQEGAAR